MTEPNPRKITNTRSNSPSASKKYGDRYNRRGSWTTTTESLADIAEGFNYPDRMPLGVVRAYQERPRKCWECNIIFTLSSADDHLDTDAFCSTECSRKFDHS